VGDLERDGGAREGVRGLEDARHPAAGEQLDEFVLIEGVADDRIAHQMDGAPGDMVEA
jgi:hypothetical protein